ncbi:Gfo/Idh/MocA family oxidoreductase [Parafrigoribacterium mesophilum]|uniref:Gfo/Idh/MocA family protein n=1 Tax=Parafrigoribacterium mesophilum TaxID=433646 RepID=UPI0031FE2509
MDRSAQPQLRLAVIGVGQRAAILHHATDGSDGGVAVLAVADSSPLGRETARTLFGRDVAIHASHTDLIAAGGVDAAFVLTPDATHARIAIDLLRAGIAVYLEKPLAITVADCDAVLAAAMETGTVLYVGHNFRHAPVVTLLRDIIRRGEIGEVKAIWCRHFVGNGGDYYFKDWHADRRATNSLLLQKGSHDLDVIHYLAGGYGRRVVAMGALALYGSITDRADRSGQRMTDWFSMDNWPPLAQTGLNPVVDVEDVSMLLLELDNGVTASYQQCHFAPDYWRNYTVIGTEGRVENFGDTVGSIVKVWNRRHDFAASGDAEYTVGGLAAGHVDADRLTVTEFIDLLRTGASTATSPVAARYAAAVGALAAQSLRNGSVPIDVPPLPADLVSYLERSTIHRSSQQ